MLVLVYSLDAVMLISMSDNASNVSVSNQESEGGQSGETKQNS